MIKQNKIVKFVIIIFSNTIYKPATLCTITSEQSWSMSKILHQRQAILIQT